MPLVTPIVAALLFLSVAVQLLYLIPAHGSRPIFDGDGRHGARAARRRGCAAVLGAASCSSHTTAAGGPATGPRFLWPGSYRALQSMADVLIDRRAGDDLAARVADNVEAYLSKMAAHRRWIYRLALYGMQAAALACRGVPLSEPRAERPPRLPRDELPQAAALAAGRQEHAQRRHPGRAAALIRWLLQRPRYGRVGGLRALQGRASPARRSCAAAGAERGGARRRRARDGLHRRQRRGRSDPRLRAGHGTGATCSCWSAASTWSRATSPTTRST